MRDGVKAEVVVADPPRAGFHPKALQALAALGPERLVYVSCNPATLARDLGELVRAGYRLRGGHPGGMFPQTPPTGGGGRPRRGPLRRTPPPPRLRARSSALAPPSCGFFLVP